MNPDKDAVNVKLELQKLTLLCLDCKQQKYPKKKWRKKEHRRLESKAWNSLFTALCSPYVTSVANHSIFDAKDLKEDSEYKVSNDLLTESYFLKVAGKSKQAKKIEILAEKLKMQGGMIESNIARFLLSLAWSVEDLQSSSLESLNYDYKLPGVDGLSNLNTKQSSFCHNADDISGRFFNHGISMEEMQKKHNIFEEKPGTHFEGKESKFAWNIPKEDTAVARTTLFGALTQSNTNSVDMTLEMPDVDNSSLSLLSAIKKSTRETSEDEGFVDESSITESNEDEQRREDEFNLFDNLNIWTDACKFKELDSYTWEKLQSYDTRQDRPFLTECGDTAFDHLCRIRKYEVSRLTDNQSAEFQLSRDELLRQSLDVLVGLSSKMYIFNKAKCCFDVNHHAITTGLSTEALRGLTKEFSNIGSFYKQINKFIDHHSENHSGLSAGLTLQAFVNSLQMYMNAYRTIIMRLREQSSGKSIVVLWVVLRQIGQQLKFLADICLCSVAFGRDKNIPKPKFPTGLKLLSYIHNLCQQNRCTVNYPLLLHVYQASAAPFLRSVSDWIFGGLCSDLNAEFFVEINDHYLSYRDKHYWTHGFKEKQNKSDLSMFENDLLEEIFACGKTINLLKKTCPEHYLLRNDLKLPTIDIKFSLKELDNVKSQCEKYTNDVQLSYENERKQKEMERITEDRMKREALVAEQNITKKAIEKINDLENQVKLAIHEKKENDLKFLKMQMLDAIEERKRAKKEQMEKDIEFLKMAEMMELEERQRLERERQELIAYYEELSLMAAKREDKALWSVRRFELRKKRIEYFESERRKTQEMNDLMNVEKQDANKESTNVLDEKNDELITYEKENIGEIAENKEANSTLDEMIEDFQTKSEKQSIQNKEKEVRNSENDEVNKMKELNSNENLEERNTKELKNANRHDDKIKFAQKSEGKETKSLIYYDDEMKTGDVEKLSQRDERFWNVEKVENQKKESTLQNILYPEKYGEGKSEQILSTRGKEPESKMKQLIYHQNTVGQDDMNDESIPKELTNEEIWIDTNTTPFEDHFDVMNELPNPDLYSSMNKIIELNENNKDIDAIYHLPIEIILQRSLHTALQSQIFVVQDAIVRYFFDHLQIGVHFAAFRKYLLLEDGEFGHSLCNQIFDKAFIGVSPKEFCIPTVLNNMISKAMQLSLFADKIEFSRQFTFSLKSIPEVLRSTDIAALDFLELRYKVPWPCNIVITENCINKYNKVFSFMLRLKKVNWALQRIWANLKKTGQNRRLSAQLRMLQLFRYEMRHFVNNVERYIVNQVIHISWQEFQHDLSEKVHGIDDLHKIHVNYLNKIVFRSLLTKNAGSVFKIISDIFSLILKMHVQLISSPWQQDGHSMVHPSFKSMCLTYNAFQEYTGFLLKVVSKLVKRGYQQHLDDFLLQVNFNGYYNERAS